MERSNDETRILGGRQADARASTQDVLQQVYRSLQEKGYDPVRQIAYYLLTGEPAYITAHQNARSLIATLERDEVIEELVRHYLGIRQPG